jgi:hypothetical protein
MGSHHSWSCWLPTSTGSDLVGVRRGLESGLQSPWCNPCHCNLENLFTVHVGIVSRIQKLDKLLRGAVVTGPCWKLAIAGRCSVNATWPRISQDFTSGYDVAWLWPRRGLGSCLRCTHPALRPIPPSLGALIPEACTPSLGPTMGGSSSMSWEANLASYSKIEPVQHGLEEATLSHSRRCPHSPPTWEDSIECFGSRKYYHSEL